MNYTIFYTEDLLYEEEYDDDDEEVKGYTADENISNVPPCREVKPWDASEQLYSYITCL